jgi:restriction system protein
MADKDDDFAMQLKELLGDTKLQIIQVEMDSTKVRGMSLLRALNDIDLVAEIYVANDLSEEVKKEVILSEVKHLADKSEMIIAPEDFVALIDKILIGDPEQKPAFSISSVVIPENKVAEGVLVKSVSTAWYAAIKEMEKDWSAAYGIDSRVWEEIIAGALKEDGYDEVVLTPRTHDFGRDVIATKKGRGAIKIIGSVKAYKPGLLVSYDDIRALMGVLSADQNASKGIITTTSGFPPLVKEDKFIAPLLPTRLELIDGPELLAWLIELSKKKTRF